MKAFLLKPRYSVLVMISFLLTVLIVSCVTVAILMDNQMSTWADQVVKATLGSPLPNVIVCARAENSIPDSQAYQKKYDFTEDWFTRNIPVWTKIFEPYKEKANTNYLEIGIAEGRSLLWMLENVLTHPTVHATAIDIFDGPAKDRYFKNIKLSGVSDKVTTIINYSQLALRDLPLDSFDIIYIDGSHAKDDVLEDAILCFRLLKEEGLLIFDDYLYSGCIYSGWIKSINESPATHYPKIAIDSFVECFDEHFEVLHNDFQVILKKKAWP